MEGKESSSVASQLKSQLKPLNLSSSGVEGRTAAQRLSINLVLSAELTNHPLYSVITEQQWQYWLGAVCEWVKNGVQVLIKEGSLPSESLQVPGTTGTTHTSVSDYFFDRPALDAQVDPAASSSSTQRLSDDVESIELALDEPIPNFPLTDAGARRWFGLDISPYFKIIPTTAEIIHGSSYSAAVSGNEYRVSPIMMQEVSEGSVWINSSTEIVVNVINADMEPSSSLDSVSTNTFADEEDTDSRSPATSITQVLDELNAPTLPSASPPTAPRTPPVTTEVKPRGLSFETAGSLETDATNKSVVETIGSIRETMRELGDRDFDHDVDQEKSENDAGKDGENENDDDDAMGVQKLRRRPSYLPPQRSKKPSADEKDFVPSELLDRSSGNKFGSRFTSPSLSSATSVDARAPAIIRTDHLMTVLTCLFQLTHKLYPNSSKSVFIALRRYIIPYLLQRSLRSIHLLMLGLVTNADEYEALDMKTLEMVLQKLLITPTTANKQYNNVRGLFVTNEDGMPWIACQRIVKRLMMTWAAAAPWLFYLYEVPSSALATGSSRRDTTSSVKSAKADATERKQSTRTKSNEPTTGRRFTVGHDSSPPVNAPGPGESTFASPLVHPSRKEFYHPLSRRPNARRPFRHPKSTSNFPERLSLYDRYQRIALIPVTLTSFSSHQNLVANSQQNVFFLVSSPSIQSRSVRLPHIQSMSFQPPPPDYFLCYLMNQLFNETLNVAYPREKQEPVLKYLEDVRPCIVDRDPSHVCTVCRKQRDEWRSAFYGMTLIDCEKVFLHFYLRMLDHSYLISATDNDAESVGTKVYREYDHALFWQQLRRVLHNKAVISALSPQVVSSFNWMRPQHIPKTVESLVESVYESCSQDNQWIQFIQIVEPVNEYTKANGRFQLETRHWKPFLKAIQQRFLFNHHFYLTSPDQLLPHHPKHSAPYPHLMTNPFQNVRQKSLLVINNVESVTGFHKEMHVSFGEGVSKSTSTSKTQGIDHGIRRGLGFDTGCSWHHRFGTFLSEENSESAVSGSGQGGFGEVGVAATGMHVVGSALKNWSTERAVGVSRGKDRALEQIFIPHLNLNANIGYDDSYKKADSLSKSESKSHDESVATRMVFEHPEALTKIVVGLKQHLGTISAIPKHKRKNRLILIFYQHSECFTELAVKRLGWSEDGIPPQNVVDGCSHHRSSAQLWMKCCHRWVPCLKCHQEKATTDECRATVATDVSHIKCNACVSTQPILPQHTHCIHRSCEQPFSVYQCSECRIWTHHPMMHCKECGKCVGREYFAYHERICSGNKTSSEN